MPDCNSCGIANPVGAEFCFSCGSQVVHSRGIEPRASRISDPAGLNGELSTTSRGADTEIDKYLGPREHIVYSTSKSVQIGKEKMHAYVTNTRLLLIRQRGLLPSRGGLSEIVLGSIGRTTIMEPGMLTTACTLEIDGMELKGQRTDIMNLYRVIHAANR